MTTTITTMDIFDANEHRESYIALGQAVCALGVEDAIASIKKLENILNVSREWLEGAKKLRIKYDESKNKKESIHRMKKILRFKSQWLSYFKSEYERFVIQQGSLIELNEFISGEWFHALSSMDLDPKKVCNNITQRYSDVDCDDLLQYNSHFDSELHKIRDFIEIKAIEGWDKMYTV